jgi:hypothetical protein
MTTQHEYDELKSRLNDSDWRLNNLYWIKDKRGKKIKFKLNWAQNDLYDNKHLFNVILKARQLGFTTLIMLYFLDSCLFKSNHSAGVIAHNLDDAQKLFRDKIKFAYDNLHPSIKNERIAKSDSARTLEFSNGSSIYVGTSLRGGTNQKLLVSEYGKISAKYPEKAKEIKTGALNTVEAGQQIFVESTAEGKVGEFYELHEKARKLKDSGKSLARLEPKAFFYAWFKNPEYVANDEEVHNHTLSTEHTEYFSQLEEDGITLTENQRVWYAIKAEQQGEDMSQEFPSTPEEAFQGSLEGAYYTKQMKKVRERGQISSVPYDSRFPVYTWWDLGTADMMTCWFYQQIKGRHNFIDYYENSDEGWEHYAKVLAEKGYNYKNHNFPHDGTKRMRGAKLFTDKQAAIDCGIRPIKITPRTKNAHDEVMNACQPILVNCWFDEAKTAQGVLHLDNYRKKWCKTTSMFLKEHIHDEASHGCDAFRTFAANVDKIGDEDKPKRPQRVSAGGWMG